MCDSKTPVTILQELCVKKKESVPHYEFLGEEISKENEKNFTFKIYTMGQESTGVGKSKKDAKHAAACAMLKILAQHLPDVREMKISPGLGIERDAVSELLNICVQRNLPKAEFELLNASGPSHAPEFTFRCHVATMQRTASHSTKKGAKQLAAQKMLTTVQEMPIQDDQMQIATVDDLLKTEDTSNHKSFKTYREYKNSDNKKQLGVKICDRHNYFKEFEPEIMSECRRIVYDTTVASVSDKVQLLLGALKLQYEVNDVDWISFPMKSFELINSDYDCFLMFEKKEFFQGIFDYLKLMMSI